jgi:hypothetical protein
MADDHLRQLERRCRETGAPADVAAWLRARRRAGELDESRLALAAALGDPVAGELSGVEPATSWQALALAQPDRAVLVRLALAVLRRLPAEPALEGLQDVNDELGTWLAEQGARVQGGVGWSSIAAAQEGLARVLAQWEAVREELIRAVGAWLADMPDPPPPVVGWLRAVDGRMGALVDGRAQRVLELNGELVELLPAAVDMLASDALAEGQRLTQSLQECAYRGQAGAFALAGLFPHAILALDEPASMQPQDSLMPMLDVISEGHGFGTLLGYAREEVTPWALGLRDPVLDQRGL